MKSLTRRRGGVGQCVHAIGTAEIIAERSIGVGNAAEVAEPRLEVSLSGVESYVDFQRAGRTVCGRGQLKSVGHASGEHPFGEIGGAHRRCAVTPTVGSVIIGVEFHRVGANLSVIADLLNDVGFVVEDLVGLKSPMGPIALTLAGEV